MVSIASLAPRGAPNSASTTVDLAQMTVSQIDALDLRSLQKADVAALSAQKLAGLKTGTIAKFSSGQIGKFSADQVHALTATQMAALSKPALQSIGVEKFSADQIRALGPTTANQFSATQIHGMSATQTQALTANEINSLTASLVAALNTAQLNASQVSAMSATTASRLSAAQINAMSGDDVHALDARTLTTAQLGGLTAGTAANFTTAQIKALSTAQTGKLSAAAAQTFLASAATTLSGDQINALTAKQLAGQSLVVGASGGLSFKLAWDSTATAAGFRNAAVHAAARLSGQIANTVQVSVSVAYGRVGNQKISSSAVAMSMAAVGGFYSYADIRGALTRNAANSSLQASIAARLPDADPTHGGKFLASSAQARALGLTPKYSAPVDGYAGLSSALPMTYTGGAVAGKFDAVAAFEHEFTEVMGRVGSLGAQQGAGVYTALDLFHYSRDGASGSPYLDLAPAAPGAGRQSFFSLDGGATSLGFYPTATGKNGDFADFTGASDPFGGGAAGGAPALSGADVAQMAVTGWNATAPAIDLAARAVAGAYHMV
ncbi:MAG: hypothetical protein ACR652_14225 [Methylocystis sp.]|uniref:hypothetical protein n=1 Tax=Methylocystis sp. TaxID=1911079 RepID=UPI003DA43129